MVQSVDKLKELLFDSETRALDALVHRVEGIEQLTLDEKALRAEIEHKIDDVFDRAGTTDRFEVSVASVLDGALRRAEVDRHAELASAIAPLVVRTVKTEIRNSRDELVEVLYPMTGRMVQAYVASAMKDLTKDINRKLEQNPVMLQLRSLVSGKSVAEMAIAESQRLVVEELYLIRRGSGELVGRWPETEAGASGRDHVMSGVLTAINEFSTEALKDDGSALRQIDLGERQLYLRVSPTYLLAAKCSGSAPQAIETVLDNSFLEAMEDLQDQTHGGSSITPAASSSILAGLSQNLEQRLDDKTGELANQAAGASPIKILAWVIGLPLAVWLSWSLYADYRTERARTIATRALTSVSELNGYPVSLDVSRLGRNVTISGLAPALEVKAGLLERVREALPGSNVIDRLSVLPNDLAAIEPRIAGVKRDVSALAPEVSQARDDIAGVTREVGALAPKIAEARSAIDAVDPKINKVRDRVERVASDVQTSGIERALDRTRLRLLEAQTVLASLASSPGPQLNQDDLRASANSIEKGLSAVSGARALVGNGGAAPSLDFKSKTDSAAGHIRDAQVKVSALGGFSLSPSPMAANGGGAGSAVLDASDLLAADADRLASIALAAAQVIAVKRAIPPPIEPGPREKLLTFARSNAIFFTNDVDFRSSVQAKAALDELAKLMRGNDVLVRVVGYTDDQGPPERNIALSDARSGVVVEALKDRGVAPGRLVKIGRVDAIGISQERGASSPNRRVEFEVGFVGEGGP